MRDESRPGVIEVGYCHDAAFACRAVHGVLGGVTPHGAVFAAFYQEFPVLPEHTEILVDEKGVKQDERHEPSELRISRTYLFQVDCDPGTAEAIGRWFIQQAEAGREAHKRNIAAGASD